MKISEFMKQYQKEHTGAWLAYHMSGTEAWESIEKSGLLATWSPFGKKGRYCTDENGHFDLSKMPFKATMVHAGSGTEQDDILFFDKELSEHFSTVIVCIPKQVVDALGGNITDGELYKEVCGYGIMSVVQDEFGTYKLSEIEPCLTDEEKKNANVRMVPRCFIAGHFNENCEFVENKLYYENLPKKEQEEIVKSVAQKNGNEKK